MRTLALLVLLYGLSAMSPAVAEPDKEEPGKIAREIADRTPESITKQVDFSKENLLLFKWSGSGRDQVSFSTEAGKEGPVVVFKYTAGLTRDLRQHSRLYAVANNATWRFEDKPGRRKDPVKITSVEQLTTHFPAAKE